MLNNKACGPSSLHNKFFKHAGMATQQLVWKLVKLCFELGYIPEDWKKAYIYPVPKPMEWENDIIKTRPITLLDTLRKMVMKVITNRLSRIMVKHNILKGNNFAGLPGGATETPIKLMNLIIKDAKIYQKPLWILLQDLSKAYDRVDLRILTKAMDRIKIPLRCTSFILDFFTGRQNAILTKGGISDFYDIKIDIDQGEVISPLLWCIYFDLLLCEIDNLKCGYELSHIWMDNVSTGSSQTLTEMVSTLGFMNDANWISSSLEQMESILSVADEFYDITSAAINKDKSKLLTNTTNQSDPIEINFGKTTLHIKPSTDPVRFLDVNIHIRLQHNLVVKDIRAHIRCFVNTIKCKPIMDRQYCYIVNHVLFSQILYKLHNTPLSQDTCNSLNTAIRKLFKAKTSFPSATPSAIIYSPLFYNLSNLWTE